MADLLFDFSDPNQAKLFPQHGWAVNSQGVKILWCPVLGLLKYPNKILQKKGGKGKLPRDIRHRYFAFSDTLKKLSITLRELHQVIRLSCDYPVNMDPANMDPVGPNAFMRVYDMAPLYTDLSFIYLRRIPDLLVTACSPFLFKHWQSVPQKFKDWVANVSQLESHRPFCNFTILSEAVVKNSEWFEALRGMSPLTGKKGIRDALEHRPVFYVIGKQQIGANRPRIDIRLNSSAKDVEINKDILPQLIESVAGFCRLMGGIHSAIGVGSHYKWGDQLMLIGSDDDVVGYWPQIGT